MVGVFFNFKNLLEVVQKFITFLHVHPDIKISPPLHPFLAVSDFSSSSSVPIHPLTPHHLLTPLFGNPKGVEDPQSV